VVLNACARFDSGGENGKLAPDSFNTQLDECSYPILMAWQLGMNDATLYQTHIKPAADFVISHGPSFGPERWEEQGGVSPTGGSARSSCGQ
jgi:glucoamylase